MAQPLSFVCALALVVAACGDVADAPAAAPPPPTSSTLPSPTQPAARATSTTTTSPSATIAAIPAPSSTGLSAGTVSKLAPLTAGQSGAPFDVAVPVPDDGPVVSVVGVSFDDTLNVRSGPGIDNDVVGELAPTATGITGTGDGWQLASGAVWWGVDDRRVRGWANSRFLSRFGRQGDVTEAVNDIVGALPTYDEMAALGLVVAEAAWDPATVIDVVLVAEPAGEDARVVVYDVIGSGDDAVEGIRLFVTGVRTDTGFALDRVEAALMCARGVRDGDCV